MPELIIDGMHIQVQQGLTLIQACELASKEIPRFCYHERLAIAGNCRMCLVELEKSPKLVASCAVEAQEGMVVHTNSDKVRKAREAVMEFLLINHPLDCPICDQGGECDLQDQAVAYGRGFSRFDKNKRAVEEKYMGPLIKTAMTRCIHCTRCVRFAEDIAGVPAIGTINRGENMEITTLEKAVNSELSGNVIDLCPVGALTSRPYAFKARPWEMKKVKCIDAMDAVGSNISVEVFGNEVMRILPRFNKEVNEEWISDKARFAYDGLANQRIDKPYIRRNRRLVPISWDEALKVAANKMRSSPKKKIGAIAGGMNSCEDMFMLWELMQYYMVHNVDCRPAGSILDAQNKSSYVLNTKITDIEKADLIVLVGTNPRWDAPIINAKIRSTWLKNQCPVFFVGEQMTPLTYPIHHLGKTPKDIEKLLSQPLLAQLEKSANPLMLVGSHLSTRKDASAVFHLLEGVLSKGKFIKKGWSGYGMIHTQAGQVGGLHVNCVPTAKGMCTGQMLEKGNLDLLYLLGADELDLSNLDKTFIIYQGSHGDRTAQMADLVLPGATYTEKTSTWVNTEGRVQNSIAAASPPGHAKDDWKILRALSEILGSTLPYDNFQQVRQNMYQKFTHLKIWNSIIPSQWGGLGGKKGQVLSTPIQMEIRDFYLTSPIARFSPTMTKCSSVFNRELSGDN